MLKSAVTPELFHDIIKQCVHTTALGLKKVYYCEYPLSPQPLMICGLSLLEKHALKYHLSHQAYLQGKTTEINLITSPGHGGLQVLHLDLLILE